MQTSNSLLDRDEFVRQILHPTTSGKRLANFILDSIFSTIFMYLCIGLIGGILLAIDIDTIEVPEAIQITGGLIFLLLPRVIYFVLLEHFIGKTIGKMITKTKVVTEDGEKPTLKQIIGRSFARFIPFEVFSFISETPIGWHDSLSGTMVIDDIPLYSLSANQKPSQDLYQE